MTRNYAEEIKKIRFSQIYSSRGLPTVEVTIETKDGDFVASCPSGASTGSKEACALVDSDICNDKCNENINCCDDKSNNNFSHNNLSQTNSHNNLSQTNSNTKKKEFASFEGKKIEKVIKNATKNLLPKITEIHSQFEFDEFLRKEDGTENLRKYGANCILPLSVAFLRMNAHLEKRSLGEHIGILFDEMKRKCDTEKEEMVFPSPNFNIINGGAHSGNALLFQEIMVNFKDDTYSMSLFKGCLFYNTLKKEISSRYGDVHTGYGDEGGFMPPIRTLEEALELIRAVNEKLEIPNLRVAVDAAANYFYKEGVYTVYTEEGEEMVDGKGLIAYYQKVVKKYPEIYLLEDPFAEGDIETWKEFTSLMGKDLTVLGDDLVVTNPKMIEEAIKEKWCNAVLIKPNQIGTITDTLHSCALAKKSGFDIMVSHRSGETEDTLIADLAVGICAEFIKAGAPRGERLVKYNRLLRIEEIRELGNGEIR